MASPLSICFLLAWSITSCTYKGVLGHTLPSRMTWLTRFWVREVSTEPYTILLDEGEANEQSHVIGYDWHSEITLWKSRPDHVQSLLLCTWWHQMNMWPEIEYKFTVLKLLYDNFACVENCLWIIINKMTLGWQKLISVLQNLLKKQTMIGTTVCNGLSTTSWKTENWNLSETAYVYDIYQCTYNQVTAKPYCTARSWWPQLQWNWRKTHGAFQTQDIKDC